MNILIIHNRYVEPGGEDEVVFAEKRMLEDHGHTVVLYERHNHEIAAFGFMHKLRFVFQEIYWSNKSYHDIRRIIAQHKPDVAHIHNTFYMVSPSVYQACFEAKVPVVQTLHNYRFICPAATFYRRGKVCEDCLRTGMLTAVVHRCWRDSSLQTWILTRVIKRLKDQESLLGVVKRYIALSEFSKGRFIKAGFSSEKVVVKPNFMELARGAGAAKEGYGIFVGSFQGYKGIKTLIKALKMQSKPFPFKIIGDGLLRGELEQLAQGLPVEFLGRKSLPEVLGYMNKALFVVVPSECYENFPRVIVEAYACATAVIASCRGALEELVEHGKTGLHFKPADSLDLAQKMDRLINDRALAVTMGLNGRRIFEQRYTTQENYRQLMDIYASVIN